MMLISLRSKYFAQFFCSNRHTLDRVKDVCDGWKVRNRDEVIFPIKALPKAYNVLPKTCQFDAEAKASLIDVSNNLKRRKAIIKQLRDEYANEEVGFDYDNKGIYEPLKHQKVMYNIMTSVDVAAILADPGTCKTGAYLWAVDKRIQRGEVKKCLIVMLSFLKENVLEEMGKQVPHLKGVVLGNKAQADKILNKKYKVEKKNVDYDVYLANYESMFSLVELFDDEYFDMVILDEAHRVGSPRSRQTKIIIDKFNCVPYKFDITGTLNANNCTSFFMPFRFLGPDTIPQANFYEFRRVHFFTVDPDGHIWKPAPGTSGLVQKIIGNISVCFKKEECIDLPPKIYQNYRCNMSPEQTKVYDKIKKDFILEVEEMCRKCDKDPDDCGLMCDKELLIKNALVMTIKLAQITSGFYINSVITYDDNGKEINKKNIIWMDSNPKLDMLVSVISNIPSDKKIIIWSNFVAGISAISDRIEKSFGPQSYLTIVKDDDAFKQVAKFREGNYRFLIANPQKASAGLNIQFSNYQAFFSNNHSFIQRDQAESRQHRKGQKEEVTIINLACTGTIDENILNVLETKKEMDMDLNSLARVAGIDKLLKKRKKNAS